MKKLIQFIYYNVIDPVLEIWVGFATVLLLVFVIIGLRR